MIVKLCECGCGKHTPLSTYSRARDRRVRGQPLRFIHGHYKKAPNLFEHRPDGTTVIFIEHKGKTLECIVWTRDYDTVKSYHWFAVAQRPSSHTLYARTNIRKADGTVSPLHMHQLLLPEAPEVDHRNHSGLDNRVYDPATGTGNIRAASSSQNKGNFGTRKHSSIFKGVSWDTRRKKWVAQIMVNYRRINLGGFDSELEASFAYQKAAKKYFGEFAYVAEAAETVGK